MTRINLLPHREMERERRKREFVGNVVATVIVGIVLAFAGGFAINRQIDAQVARNEYIKAGIAVLNGEIAEIKGLEEALASLRARQQAVEDLQSDRTIPVHLFDEMVRLMPEGVSLEKLQQLDLVVNLSGIAQSNERVAELLRNLSERSDWLEKPQLDEIKEILVKDPARPAPVTGSDTRKAYEFKLNVLIKRTVPAGGRDPARGSRTAAAGMPLFAAGGGAASLAGGGGR